MMESQVTGDVVLDIGLSSTSVAKVRNGYTEDSAVVLLVVYIFI